MLKVYVIGPPDVWHSGTMVTEVFAARNAISVLLSGLVNEANAGCLRFSDDFPTVAIVTVVLPSLLLQRLNAPTVEVSAVVVDSGS